MGRGGNNGAETITLNQVESQQDNVYMIFVNNYLASKVEEFKVSEAHVTITDGVVSHNLDLHPGSHENENWWLSQVHWRLLRVHGPRRLLQLEAERGGGRHVSGELRLPQSHHCGPLVPVLVNDSDSEPL